MVGSDWKGKEVVGSDYAKEVRFFDRIGDYSTTNIIKYYSSVSLVLMNITMASVAG